jgi:Polysaccharide lyase
MLRTALLLGLSLTSAQVFADVSWNGDWANFAPFYGPDGWHNGKVADRPGGPADIAARSGNWPASEFVSFYGMNNPWLTLLAKAPDRAQLVLDKSSPKGGMVARIEVRPGDFGSSGDSTQFVSMWGVGRRLSVTEESGHEFYALSVKLSPDWQPPGPDVRFKFPLTWGIVMQLHSPNAFAAPPALALSATSDFHLSMCSGDLLEGGQRTRNRDATDFPFTDGSLARGRWVEFVLDIVWSYDEHGSVSVYRRDEGERDFADVLHLSHVSTLTSKSGMTPSKGDEHYWAAGYYRSRNAALVSVLWLGPMARGSSFDDVAQMAFGSSGRHQ